MGSRRSFPDAARMDLRNPQLRRNVARATTTIRARRAAAVAEVPDWEDLRERARGIKASAMRHLAEHLEELERSVTEAGGVVHWAETAEDANAIVERIIRAEGASEVVKVKSMTTEEIGLNDALAASGIEAHETDLAELIIQLGGDRPSHLLVPAIHRNRAEIRDIFRARLPGCQGLDDEPAHLAEAARRYLRGRFLEAEVAISGANFAISETGTVCVVESEGNGRMCTTLPRVLVTVMGIEKVLPRLDDLAVMLQLLPRSSTGERMNPYTSLWTGVHDADGPESFHLVLLDAGRTDTLADPIGREALHCIRCSACVNVCPVYEQTGGHAYDSPYAGPIGAILSPQLSKLQHATSLPGASTLCGACYAVCPVKIDIPTALVHLRATVVRERREAGRGERVLMRALARVFEHRGLYELAQRLGALASRPLARDGVFRGRLPGPLAGWSSARDLRAPPAQSFRGWWRAQGERRPHGRP